ncbi:hypothetical protein [Paracoccus sp. DMF]|uniref:hypothetical protein n=1 Tax=Paracoccus sp. DMF TaxID=400837 RepID=UPI0021E38B9A|nr:hypothetical protein [Paracoccus sp. DMF]
MTTCLSISPGHATEAPALPFTPTPMTQRFAFMQAALALYLDAERDLTQSGAWDPACDHWLRDAEAARTALAAALDAVCATGPVRAQDRPLRQLARIARVMLLATDEAEFAQAHGLIAAFGAVLRCPGSGPVDRHVDRMLAEARAQLAAVAALPDYAPEVDDSAGVDLAPAAVIGAQDSAPRQTLPTGLPRAADMARKPSPTPRDLPGAAAA